VLVEVSVSLVLLAGAGLLFRSLMTLLDTPLGFTTDRMLTMRMAPTGENYRTPRSAHRPTGIRWWSAPGVPVVEAVALTTGLLQALDASLPISPPSSAPRSPSAAST
jgi:hypothetical protein